MNTYKEFKRQFGVGCIDMIDFFLRTDGCYILKYEKGMSLAYRCDKDDPLTVNPDGDDMFIQWACGDMLGLLSTINPEYILFDKNDRLKCYKFSTLYKRLSK